MEMSRKYMSAKKKKHAQIRKQKEKRRERHRRVVAKGSKNSSPKERGKRARAAASGALDFYFISAVRILKNSYRVCSYPLYFKRRCTPFGKLLVEGNTVIYIAAKLFNDFGSLSKTTC